MTLNRPEECWVLELLARCLVQPNELVLVGRQIMLVEREGSILSLEMPFDVFLAPGKMLRELLLDNCPVVS